MQKTKINTLSYSSGDVNLWKDRAFAGISPQDSISKEISSEDCLGGIMGIISDKINDSDSVMGVFFEQNNDSTIIDTVKSYSPLFAKICNAINFKKRFCYIDNNVINNLWKKNNVMNMLSLNVGSYNGSRGIAGLLDIVMLKTLYHNIMESSPMYKKERLYQYIYKPQLFFSIPPKCNVIFRNLSISPTMENTGSPTRSVMVGRSVLTGTVSNDTTSPRMFFPEKIENNLSSFDSKKYKKLRFKDTFTDEERIEERVESDVYSIPFPDMLNKIKDARSIARIFGRYWYEISTQHMQPLQATLDLDLNLICGLSTVMYDKDMGCIFGRIRTKTDTIDIDGGQNSTKIEIVNVRTVPLSTNRIPNSDFQIEKYDDLYTDNLSSTGIFDLKYNNENIGDSFYKLFFNTNSILSDHFESGEAYNNYSIYNALYSLYKKNISTNKSDQFYNKYKMRSIATESEYMSFIGAEPKNPRKVKVAWEKYKGYDRYKSGYSKDDDPKDVSSPFMTERQEIVVAYVQKLKDSHYVQTC